MSKKDIINKLKQACSSQDVEIKKSDLSKIFNALMEIVKDKLNEKGEVHLHGIGTFSTAVSQEKQCRNPQNGEIITIPQKIRVKFKASQALLNILNKEKEEVVS